MCFKHHVVADVVGGQEVDAVLIAAVDDDVSPIAIEKLERRQVGAWSHSCEGRVTIFGGSSQGGLFMMALHKAALRS